MTSTFVMFFSLLSAPVQAQDTVDKAYQREFAYLAAEKRALQARVDTLDTEATRAQGNVEAAIARLEVALKRSERSRDDVQDSLEARERAVMGEDESRMILDATVAQAAEGLSLQIAEGFAPEQGVAAVLSAAVDAIASDRSVQKRAGTFFDPAGVQLTGDVIEVGRVAAFGVSEQVAGPLRPIGEGKYQLREGVDAGPARTLASGQAPASMGLFVFEGARQRVEEPSARSALETVEAGGIVAWIIAGLGLLALGLAVVRGVMLQQAAGRIKRDEAWLGNEGMLTAVVVDRAQGPIAAVTRRIQDLVSTSDRDSLFDAADEVLSGTKSGLERFSTVILVVAAVAPLLGLLGTVTGMIATFAVITEHGTGDPRMLSGGISEALITTQLGLIVAIPALLLGNMLNGWSKGLFERVEQGLLVYVNAHAKGGTAASSTLGSGAVLGAGLGLSEGDDVVA